MRAEEFCTGLELFLSKDKHEKLREKIKRFEEDEFFLNYLGGDLIKKNIRDVKVEDLIPVSYILDSVVFLDYPVENPVHYSSLYKLAIFSNKLDLFKGVLEHLNKISGIEKTLVSFGIEKNSNLGARNNQNNTDTRQYVFSDASYLGFMHNLLESGNNSRDGISLLATKLGKLERHVSFLKTGEIDLKKLFENNYSVLLRSVCKKNENNDNLTEDLERVAGLFKKLDSKGFDMYNRSNILVINSWIETGKLNRIEILANYISKEALIYVSGLHLKSE